MYSFNKLSNGPALPCGRAVLLFPVPIKFTYIIIFLSLCSPDKVDKLIDRYA